MAVKKGADLSYDKSGNNPLRDRVDRYICFQLNGYLWEIEMQTFKEDDKVTAQYWEHLIDTFNIADNAPN